MQNILMSQPCLHAILQTRLTANQSARTIFVILQMNVAIPDNCWEKFIGEHVDWTKRHVDEEFGDALCHDDICH